ncbi:uncharacterized protein MELLADRAFT_73983 [Melampsora larici-populina 98AG31]|uniref:Tim44-like domain-containing protein n=1 Tax=Melampsora larici-populina (strain 98AG31 / pathotype 3-4-7) TaxID=747676 RepID=F4R5L6_MELLP|nr:uncharacterized protein MELLADRAFT_73983 [Melampsora larici-populina 98AG31]EGG12240.1 hypothetical protein MELLADRAFT_73983 [Melampsora larici-populina 98AG31]
MQSLVRIFSINRQCLSTRPTLLAHIGLERTHYSTLAESSATRQSIAINEFEEEVEKELAKLPVKRAEEARRQIRNERRAERSGQSLSRQNPLIIPYIAPYEGPTPDSSKGLWTHLRVGWRKNMLKEAWGQWLGSRQSRRSVDSVMSASNRSWLADFMTQADESVFLYHKTLASGEFEDSRIERCIHPNMIESLKQKRNKLLETFSPSHSISWKLHSNITTEANGKGKNPPKETEMEIVTMRAAPFDKGGTVVQIAVRFRTYQSLEVRDECGLLVSGSHESPQLVMEYFVFQKRMSMVNQPFLLFQQVYEDQKPACLPV